MNTVERLKIAIEEVAFVRTGCELTWSERIDLEARTIAVGFNSVAEAHELGRKLRNPEEIEWDLEAAQKARDQNMAPMPYPTSMLKPLSEEVIDACRIDILRSLLKEGAINVKF
jgi:hypothetical protein